MQQRGICTHLCILALNFGISFWCYVSCCIGAFSELTLDNRWDSEKGLWAERSLGFPLSTASSGPALIYNFHSYFWEKTPNWESPVKKIGVYARRGTLFFYLWPGDGIFPCLASSKKKKKHRMNRKNGQKLVFGHIQRLDSFFVYLPSYLMSEENIPRVCASIFLK